MSDDFIWIPAASTDIGRRIREEWKKLGQLPPDQDPKILENRKKVLEYGKCEPMNFIR